MQKSSAALRSVDPAAVLAKISGPTTEATADIITEQHQKPFFGA